ncbi:MAG: metal ABC transporter permease [Lachnoclostridium sp.]|nr:metal ABC transporter permease [Lachnoclostridium sp.]
MLHLLEYDFFRNALIGLILIAISSAIIGTYVVTRRMVAISGGITHASFGGLGLGYFMGINPVVTAILFAAASAIGVEWMAHDRRIREDSAIAVVWALGMALGVLFVFLTPGYVPELNSFLFGNILTVTTADIISFALYTIILIGVMAVGINKIILVSFDADFARVRGLQAGVISMFMTLMTAICIVLTIRMVGIMLLMSMLSLPTMTAELFSTRYRSIMLLSIIISVVCSMSGLMLATVIDVPCSALIVIVMIMAYIVCKIFVSLQNKKSL